MLENPTGILKNTSTGRFHPISFRFAPLPGGSKIQRYKSFGHHTEGFASIDEAKEWIAEQAKAGNLTDKSDYQLDWDGQDTPATIAFF